MATTSMALSAIAGLLLISMGPVPSRSQPLGNPPYCLLNVLDYYPCKPSNPSRIVMPKANEFGMYSTRTRDIKCVIRSRDDVVRPIESFADGKMKLIYSPGKQLEPKAKYGNQQLVVYNISCPPNNIAFFNIDSINLESADCFDNNLQAKRCVDYVQVRQPGFDVGVSESCGSKPSTDHVDQVLRGNFEVIFRSSDKGRFAGFQASAVCLEVDNPKKFKPRFIFSDLRLGDRKDKKSCDHFELEVAEAASSPGVTVLKHQTMDNFIKLFKKQVSLVKKRKGNKRRNKIGRRVRYMKVRYNEKVVFTKGKLIVRNSRNNKLLRTVSDVNYLYTLNKNYVIKKRVLSKLKWPLKFDGPGVIRIAGRSCFFILFVVDPKGTYPTETELKIINVLTRAQFTLIKEDESDRKLLEPDPITDVQSFYDVVMETLGPAEWTVSSQKNQKDLTDKQLQLAIRSVNACNPVLRIVAQATIEIEKRNGGRGEARIQSIRDTVFPPLDVDDLDDSIYK